MKKRILSILLTLVMVLSLLPVTAFAAATTEVANFAALKSACTESSGIYKLNGDVKFTADIEINSDFKLDLNNYVLNLNSHMLFVSSGKTFELYDTSGTKTTRYYNKDATTGLWTLAADQTKSTDYTTTGGVITGGNANYAAVNVSGTFIMHGGNISGNQGRAKGSVSVNATGTFTMEDGNISGNATTGDGAQAGGSGVHVGGGMFTMKKGTISNNTAVGTGGNSGVFVNSGSTVVLGGTAKITGNKSGTGEGETTKNLCLWDGAKITLGTGADVPAAGMSVGVTMYAPGPFTVPASGAEEAQSYFSADDSENNEFGYDDNSTPGDKTDDFLKLTKRHAITNGTQFADAGTNHGYITVKEKATVDTTVTVTVTPNEGYTLKSLIWYPTTTPSNTHDITAEKSFTMYNFPITVKAEFEVILPHTHDGITFTPWAGTTSLPTTAGNWYLTEDVTLSGNEWNVPAGTSAETKTTNLDLNGHVIRQTAAKKGVIIVPGYAALNLYDCNSENKAYKFKVYSSLNGLWGYLGAWNSGSDTETADVKKVTGGVITGGGISGNSDLSGGGVKVFEQGSFTMNGGTICGNTVSNMGGGVINAGTFTMTGGTICGNTANSYGGGVTNASTFTMTGGTICSNTAPYGGGVYNGLTFTMTGGTISGNTATATKDRVGGGGVFNYTRADTTITGGTISGNTASAGSGGISGVGTTLTLGGTVVIKDNTVGAVGSKTAGNLYLPSGRTFTLGTKTATSEGNGVPVPAAGMSVGVTTQTAPTTATPVQITANGTEVDVDYFFADKVGQGVVFNTDHLELCEVLTFKAVYDTTGGANTLTFYYDAADHSGANITVYDDLPAAATGSSQWGYDSIRSDVKSVVIDSSVANYHGLTSTAEMFYNMKNAESITGAEHLDVSGVTTMNKMFYNFGYSSTKLNAVPDVSKWDTSNVTDMTSLFNNYGYNSTGLNAVPDVSEWNTSNVTDMTSLFSSYGYNSTALNAVPDVSKWNTSNVTKMHSTFRSYGKGKSAALNAVPDVSGWNTAKVTTFYNLFSGYGAASTALSTVPDVSKWDTSNVTSLQTVFYSYGAASTALNAVPDVSGWNTAKVTTMGGMFSSYGAASNALEAVPNVSGWNTEKVTSMGSMFKSYGEASKNLDFTLDLSAWSIASVTNADYNEGAVDVFTDAAKAAGTDGGTGKWSVTIPAVTAGSATDNTKDHWYLANGTDSIVPADGREFTVKARPSGGSTPTVTVPVSGDGNSVKVPASVSGSTATVKPIKDADLAKVSGGELVEIDLSGLKKNIDTAKLPTETVEKIGEKDGMSVKLTTATVTFDKLATQEIASQADGSTVELVVDNVKEVSLNAAQKEAVSKLDTAIIIDVHLASNGARLCSESKGGFGGGKATVVLPYEIENNRTPADYSVFYVDDAGKLQKLNAVYDKELAAFVFEVEHFSVYVVAYNGNACPQDSTCVYARFTDADTKAWYHDGVHFCVENGYMQGVSADMFEPSGTLSRAMIVTMLWRLEGEPIVNYAMSFQDVEADRWYTEAIRWAQSTGVVEGYSAEAFGPDDDVLREELATILYRYAQSRGEGFTGDWMFPLDFVDRADISSWANEAVHWCSMKGIVGGKEGKVFDPQGKAERAEAAAMLQRFCENENIMNK